MRSSTVASVASRSGGGAAPGAAASKLLHGSGFSRVYNLYEGFEGYKATSGPFKGQRVVNGWKNRALPWGYRLPASKMYFNFAPSATGKP